MEAIATRFFNRVKSKGFKDKINFFMDAFIAYGLVFGIIMCLIDIGICYFI